MDKPKKSVEQLRDDIHALAQAFDPRTPQHRRSPTGSILDQVEGIRLGLEEIEQEAGWIIRARLMVLKQIGADISTADDSVLKSARRIAAIADELRNSK